MQLSKREKILIILSGALLVCFLIYNFILSPQLTRLNQLKAENLRLEKDTIDSKDSINSMKTLEKNINLKTTEISQSTDKLFPELKQNEIILLLDRFINDSNITIEGINFSDIELKPIEYSQRDISEKEDTRFRNIVNQYNNIVKYNKDLVEESDNGQDIEEDNSNPEEEIKVENLSATMIYSGNYFEIINFLSLIDNYDKSIIIRGLTIIENEGRVTGNILLDFYGIPKFEDLEDNFVNTPSEDTKGKENPFQIQ